MIADCRKSGRGAPAGSTLPAMGENQYWSVEECCWVDCPGAAHEAEVAVPEQRPAEPVLEPVEA
jgi:hypothetical protein